MAQATKMYSKDELKTQKLAELKKLAKKHGISIPKSGEVKEKKITLIKSLLKVASDSVADEVENSVKKNTGKKGNRKTTKTKKNSNKRKKSGGKKSSGSTRSKKSNGKANNSGKTLDINLVKHDKNIDDVPKKTQKQIQNEIENLFEKTEAQLAKECKSANVELTDRQSSKKRAMVRKVIQAKYNITLEAYKEIKKSS